MTAQTLDVRTGSVSDPPEGHAPHAPGPGRSPWTGVAFALAILLLVALMGWLSFWLSRFTIDDAFITWRYGRSFVRTGHWNWNPVGSPRVEAYTNPLFAFVSVVPAALHLPVELFFKVLGLVLLLVGIGVAARLRDVPRTQRLVLIALIAANPVFISHMYSGLETGSFALLLALLYGRLYRKGRLGRAGCAFSVLVALSRPEGMLYAIVALAWNCRRDRREMRRSVVTLGVLAAYWGARALYFGHLLPNTYYVKSSGVTVDGVMHRIADPIAPLVAFLLAGVVVGELLWRGRVRSTTPVEALGIRRGADSIPAILAAVSCAVVLLFYPLSNLIMDIDNRFRWQLIAPVALVLLCRPLRGVRAPLGASPRSAAIALGIMGLTILNIHDQPQVTPAVATVGGAVALAAAVLLWGFRVPAVLAAGAVGVMTAVSAIPLVAMVGGFSYRTHLGAAHGELGKLMAQDRSIKGLVAMGDSGLFPYSLNRDQSAIDIGGLADPYLMTGIPEATWAAQGAAVVVLNDAPVYGKNWFGDRSSYTIVHYALEHHWTFLPGLPFGGGYWLNVYLKPGTGAEFESMLAARRPAVEAAMLKAEPGGWDYARAHMWDFPFLTERP